MRRDPKPNGGGLFPKFHRVYLNKWVWFAGLLACYVFIIPAIFWVQIFAVEGYAL